MSSAYSLCMQSMLTTTDIAATRSLSVPLLIVFSTHFSSFSETLPLPPWRDRDTSWLYTSSANLRYLDITSRVFDDCGLCC